MIKTNYRHIQLKNTPMSMVYIPIGKYEIIQVNTI
jgi:hypothetical protein